jgi:hypothetical protein
MGVKPQKGVVEVMLEELLEQQEGTDGGDEVEGRIITGLR